MKLETAEGKEMLVIRAFKPFGEGEQAHPSLPETHLRESDKPRTQTGKSTLVNFADGLLLMMVVLVVLPLLLLTVVLQVIALLRW